MPRASTIFQMESHDYGRGFMTSSLVLLMIEKLKHMKILN